MSNNFMPYILLLHIAFAKKSTHKILSVKYRILMENDDKCQNKCIMYKK